MQVYACKPDDAGLRWFTHAGSIKARPGLRRHRPRRRGASRAGAARGPAGPARPSSPPPPPSRRIPGRSRPVPGRPGRSAAAAQFGPVARCRQGPAGPARHLSSPSSPPSRCTPAAWGPDGLRRRHRRRPRRRGASRAGGGPGLVRPGLWSLILRCVIRCASESSVRRGPAAGRFYLSSCAFTHWTWVGR